VGNSDEETAGVKIIIEIQTKKKTDKGSSVTVVAMLDGYHKADPTVQQVADMVIDGLQQHMMNVASDAGTIVKDHLAQLGNAGRG